MPIDPRDILGEVTDAVSYDVGHNLNRLQRYGVFYRRLRSWPRIAGFLERFASLLMVGWGGLFGLLAILWGAIAHRFSRKPPQG